MKKFLISLLLTLALCAILFNLSACAEEAETPPTEPPASSAPANGEDETLNERLASATGTYTLTISGVNELTVSSASLTTLGATGATEIVVDGGATIATVKATGSGTAPIKAASGKLTFKNVVFQDDTPKGANEPNYLAFDGELRFENCVFEDSISLKKNAEAIFVDCEFVSSISRCYSVWVTGGSAYFTNCNFTGYRGLKIHEASTSEDVVEVIADGCTFQELTEKVGVAIGNIRVAPTLIELKNCEFYRCQPWDQGGSLEGANGVYESDTDTTTFDFLLKNNTVL
ncbi:MAG: hypothetical protein IJ514_07305 [Clostridia bacterium]|nr:hypothetical protein [Clostridia bacterium]